MQKAKTSTLRFDRQRVILVLFRLLVITKWRRRKRLPPLIFFCPETSGLKVVDSRPTVLLKSYQITMFFHVSRLVSPDPIKRNYGKKKIWCNSLIVTELLQHNQHHRHYWQDRMVLTACCTRVTAGYRQRWNNKVTSHSEAKLRMIKSARLPKSKQYLPVTE